MEFHYRLHDDGWSGQLGPAQVGATLDLDRRLGPEVEVRILKQVHGNRVLDDRHYQHELQEADGLTTLRRATVLVIKTADCLPVLLYDGTRIAAIHAGWRGTAAGILAKAVAAFGDQPIHAVLGPAISWQNYEVDDDLYGSWRAREPALEAFLHEHLPNSTKRKLDLKGFAVQQLLSLGVVHVHQIPMCTFEGPLPSYRRDGNKAGRIKNYIVLP